MKSIPTSKQILFLACTITLLATAGCVFVGGRRGGVVVPVPAAVVVIPVGPPGHGGR